MIAVATRAAYAAGSAELAEISRVGAEHRVDVGLSQGDCMSDAQCHRHLELVALELERAGVDPGARHWYTAQHVDGRIGGTWAHSWLEAALRCAFTGELAWLVVDDALDVYGQYYPNGRTATSPATFPVTSSPATRAELAMLEQPAGALF